MRLIHGIQFKRYKIEILSCIALMLVAGFVSISQIPKDEFISNDGCSYAVTAKNLVGGKGYTYMGEPNVVFPPAYPLNIALFYIISGNIEKSGYYASSFAWMMSIIPLFLIVLILFRKRLIPTILTMLLLATNPQLNTLSRKVLAESTYMLFLFWSVFFVVYFLIEKKSSKISHYILIGVFLSLAYLARPEGFVFMLLLCGYIFYSNKKQLGKGLLLSLIVLISFFAVASPYVYYLQKHTGHLVLSGRVGITLVGGERIGEKDYDIHYEKQLYGITPDRTGVYMYRGMFFSMLDYLITNRADMLGRLSFNLKEYFITLCKILFPMGIIALLFTVFPKGDYNKKVSFFILLLILPIFANAFFFLIERYLYQYLAFIYILCGLGLYKLGLLLKERLKLKIVIITSIQLALILLLNLPVFSYYVHPVKPKERSWNEHKEMGIWMKENIPDIDNKVVVSRKAFVPFYSGAIYKALPWVENRFELFHYLDNVKADYLIVDTRYFRFLRPRIEYLLDTSRHFEPIEPIKTIENKKHKVVLYKFKGY